MTASSVGELVDDQTSTRRRYRKARLAVVAADKARELAGPRRSPVWNKGDGERAREPLRGGRRRRGGSRLAGAGAASAVALRLVRELCANGGAPANRFERDDGLSASAAATR